MTSTIESFTQAVINSRYNPAGIQKAMVGLLKDMTLGQIELVDPTNPVAQVLEAAATSTAAFMIENKTLNRFEYPFSAQTLEELYPHMSDKDHLNRFALPSKTKVLFVFDKTELLNRLVLDPDTGIKKLIIPRNTSITVAQTVFGIHYPIEIRQMVHGGFQIVHDVSLPTALQTLTTNLVPWQIIKTDEGVELLVIEVAVEQFSILSRTAAINVATGFQINFEITDEYYTTRVWIDQGNGEFTEMATTYTDATYDLRTPTAVLKVIDKVVTVKIPQVYLTTGLLNRSLRIDIYQTKGPITLELGNYTQDQFVANFEALNPFEKNEYVAPLKALRTLYVYSTDSALGGNVALDFDTLRLRVIQNAVGYPDLPITNVQIESSLDRAGYQIIKNIDTVTNRIFLATRPMPDPLADSELITAAGAGIGLLSVKISEAVALTSVIDNGDQITLTPKTIFRYRRGILELVPSAQVQDLTDLPADQKAIAVNEGSYYYTPFHYVLDASQHAFSARPYYLDGPQILTKSFIGENDTTLFQVGTANYTIERITQGYRIIIQTQSSDEFKAIDDSEVHVQLAFKPTGDQDYAYLLGTLINKTDEDERFYQFDLITNYSIGSDHEMALTNFQMYDQSDRLVDIPLETEFELLYSTSTTLGSQWILSSLDSLIGHFQLPVNTKAITQERFKIRLGYFLETLWARSRSVVSEAQYETWAVDVPATYDTDVFVPDPVTGASFTIENGDLVYQYLHRVGDPVLDGNGDPIYKHRIGDVKLDAYGNPVITMSRDMQRQVDFFLIEGSYYFATNLVSQNYREMLVGTVVQWLTQELAEIEQSLLEQTNLYFYPTSTLGQIDVMFGSGLLTTINAAQEFQVTLYVNTKVYSNVSLRETLTRKTIETIDDYLKQPVVSVSNILDGLKDQYQNDVISIDFSGLGGKSNFNVVTVVDDVNRLAIKKKLVARTDETTGLVDGVSVTFIRYERSDVRN